MRLLAQHTKLTAIKNLVSTNHGNVMRATAIITTVEVLAVSGAWAMIRRGTATPVVVAIKELDHFRYGNEQQDTNQG